MSGTSKMEVPFCFINERSFVQPIDVKNTLRFLSLSVRLLAAALANSPLRGSDKAPQLQLTQTNFTKTCYHFCHSTVVRRICVHPSESAFEVVYILGKRGGNLFLLTHIDPVRRSMKNVSGMGIPHSGKIWYSEYSE